MQDIQKLIEEEKAKIIAQTAKINWQELERFYAQGKLILVDESLDLVEVGYSISLDDATKVIEWMESGLLKKDFNDQAKEWADTNAKVWSVVIKPWVLVQKITA